MHRYLTLTLLATSLTVFAEPPATAHPIAPVAKVTKEAKGKEQPGKEDKARAKKVPATPQNVLPSKANQPKTTSAPAKPADEAKANSAEETEQLNKETALITARANRETAELQAEVARMKVEKEHLAETLALEEMKRKSADLAKRRKFEQEQEKLTREATIAKAKADRLASELKAKQAEWLLETSRLEAEIKSLETAALRENYADEKPAQLTKPVLKDGTLVISDRRISLNGLISSSTADHITTRIDYFNNKNPKLPIFLVIDDSPGGSVMSGYRILKAMEGSRAPIYVVVKSFAASMAATIATLAERSYAYPNAIILHHQMSNRIMFANLNITEQKELVKESQKWWKRLAGPVAEKMGITTEEFIAKMYESSSSGDWSEFADEAQRLKWIDHIVPAIHETSLVKNPDARKPVVTTTRTSELTEEVDANGRPVQYLPRTNPRDYYFLYNPDQYYRFR